MTTEATVLRRQVWALRAAAAGRQAPHAAGRRARRLRDTPGLYRLFRAPVPTVRQVRAALFCPGAGRPAAEKPWGALRGRRSPRHGSSRSPRRFPDDLIALRRLVIQLQPAVGWLEVARLVWYLGPKAKRRFVEDYYIALHKLDKGANCMNARNFVNFHVLISHSPSCRTGTT